MQQVCTVESSIVATSADLRGLQKEAQPAWLSQTVIKCSDKDNNCPKEAQKMATVFILNG